ncbi:hypothetical protein BRARA_I03818 [Brassica rapa]|uniref:S-protein homolog n=1 Tax=Brassica campestris TaxID=3711 RepID=A0A397Y8C7_BRACM|nr:hypothetical protein BRARA_I03818 [Brassica rapa]
MIYITVAFSNKLHCISMFMIITYLTLILFASGLDVSNTVSEAQTQGSGLGGLFPLSPKHVVIHNTLANGGVLNDWSFRFRVNIWKSTKFRCHFTWCGGRSHYFNIFTVARDDSLLGETPDYRECIWEVGKVSTDEKTPMCRVDGDGVKRYCFGWDDDESSEQ